MAIETNTTSRSASFFVVIAGLMLICVGLATMMFITIVAATRIDDPEVKKVVARLAWMSLAMLCLAIMMTVWVLMRYIRHRMRDESKPGRPSTYINAWELAGKRFQLNEDNEPEDPDYLLDDGDDENDDDRYPSDRWR